MEGCPCFLPGMVYCELGTRSGGICAACRKDEVPQPVYTVNPGDIMIQFTAPEDRIIRSVKVTDRVTDPDQALLQAISEDPGYTLLQLAEKMKVSRKNIAMRLKKMKDSGVIERIGSDRKG